MNTQIAVVTVVHGRHPQLGRVQRSLSRGARIPDHWVVVAMDDPVLATWRVVTGVEPHVVGLGADVAALPLAAARNLGAQRAIELGADVLVFLDVDCLAGRDLVSGYARAVAGGTRTIWSGPVTYLPAGLGEAELMHPERYDAPHPARPAPSPGEVLPDADPRLFWSLSFALSAPAWVDSGGFHEGFTGYGAEDTDFARKASERGLEFAWVGDARAYHQFHPVQDPPVEHLDAILRNATLFHERWGEWVMEGWLDQFAARGLVTFDDLGWHRPADPAPVGA